MRTRSASTRAAALLGLLVMCGLLASSGLYASSAQANTDSAVTVSAKDYDPNYESSPTPDLKISVSQTQDLIQQAITVSWEGGKESGSVNLDNGRARDFLQVMQCWGDEPGSNGTRPNRETCVYGGVNNRAGTRQLSRTSAEMAALPEQDLPYTASNVTAIPFRSATGETVAGILDGRILGTGDEHYGILRDNRFYSSLNTNEVPRAASGADGSGSIPFQVLTGQQSPGLGCGAVLDDGEPRSCWLVVIPRGDRDPLNPDSPVLEGSGLFWENWQHHLAVRLDFRPMGGRCPIGAQEKVLSGSELVTEAVRQWQPALCASEGGSTYAMITVPESDALLTANRPAPAALAIGSRAMDQTLAVDNLAYAPISLTGITIGFAVDRSFGAREDVPPEEAAKVMQPMESMKLTPRLVAKLVTASYRQSMPRASSVDMSHLGENPWNVVEDPEFLALNPHWGYLQLGAATGLSDVLLPQGRSDTARAIWDYILADPDAKAFLDGTPDEHGMIVNPYYSTNPEINPTGSGLEVPRDDFPKADPVTYAGTDFNAFLDTKNLITERPYVSSLSSSASYVLQGDSRAPGAFDPVAVPPKYSPSGRQMVGLRRVLGLTDASAAARYQVVEASLRNPAGEYVAPSSEGFLAAAGAMVAEAGQPQVLRFDPASELAKGTLDAYPLTMPVYAATNIQMTDAELRADYADFIEFVATDGQTPGTGDGQLPAGYAPIPQSWRDQALVAAAAIRDGAWPAPEETETPPAEDSNQSSQPGTNQRPTQPTAAATTQPPSTSGNQPAANPTSNEPSNPAPSGRGNVLLTGANTPADPALGWQVGIVPLIGGLAAIAAVGIPLVTRIGRSP